VYELVVEAGVYRAESIKVAEAAKVIENAQRDINIAFMNELSMIFNQMNLDTRAVLDAASTKWNFLKFSPGLVGGHCIGIDPYYLTYKAEDTGYHSKIILAGRHINDGMASYVAQQVIKKLMKLKQHTHELRIGILGLAYKPDSTDTRNSKVFDVMNELKEYGAELIIYDPIVSADQVNREYGLIMSELSELRELDAVIVAVPHKSFLELTQEQFASMYRPNSAKLLVDVQAQLDKTQLKQQFEYWSL